MSKLPQETGTAGRPARPRGVTILALGVLIIAGINLLKLRQALVDWDFLRELLPISPLYLALNGLVWGFLGLALTWGLWRGQGWAPGLTRLAALLYSLYYWTDRLVLSASPANRNWPFMAVVNLSVFIMILWILSRRKTKAYFGVLHDR